jgi:hypothetical protein
MQVPRALLFAAAVLVSVQHAHAGGISKPVHLIEMSWAIPESLESLTTRADAVLRVQVLTSRPRAFDQQNLRPGAPAIRTEHKVKVLNAVASNGGFRMPDSREMTLLQIAGRYETDKVIYEIAGEEPFEAGQELLVFVHWNKYLNGYEVQGPYAVFRVRERRVEPLTEWAVGENRRGMMVDRLEREIRSYRQR